MLRPELALARVSVAPIGIVLLVGMIGLAAAFYAVGWRPMSDALSETEDFRLATAESWALEAVNDIFLQHKVIAAQIASRSAIRDAQVALLDGTTTRAAFVDFSAPKLADALDPANGVMAIDRYLPDGTRVLRVGMPIADAAAVVADGDPPSDDKYLFAIHSVDGVARHAIYRSALVTRDGRPVGYDDIAISTADLARALQAAGGPVMQHALFLGPAAAIPILPDGPEAIQWRERFESVRTGEALPDRFVASMQDTDLPGAVLVSITDLTQFSAGLSSRENRLLAVLGIVATAILAATFLAVRPVIRRMEAMQAAARTRRVYRRLFDGSSALMLLLDAETGAVVQANAAAARYFTGADGPIQGMRPLDIDRMQRATPEYAEPFAWQTRTVRADGLPRDVEVHASAASWEGRPAFFAILHDITDRLAQAEALAVARREAEAASRAKSEFLSAMSHELRTPLNAILGFSEVIRDGMLGDPTVPEVAARYNGYAADIHRSGGHLVQVIDDILDIGRIEAGRFALTLGTVDPRAVVTEGVRTVEARAAAHRLRLTVDLPQACRHFRGDKRAVRQILFNLLSNAVKFTPDGGSVTVAVRQPADGTTHLSVADTGIGISQADRAQLFQPFARGDTAVRNAIEGTGLGLVLVRRLSDLHGATVTLDSREGAGSVFTVIFPTVPAVDGESGEAGSGDGPSGDDRTAGDPDRLAKSERSGHLDGAGP